ncbi:MAG: hypothetical protein M3Q69_09425 [Acidobacteriota bacterium]|nr:hypothetical protein [Acidobacteriota bacterium]
MTRPLHRSAVAIGFALVALAGSAEEREFSRPVANDGPGLSLRVADEVAPAGSIVQIKVEVTEPKPISTGRGKIKTTAFSTVEGIVLMNKGEDTFGVAMVDGQDLTFSITSPSSRFGTQADYPILGIAGKVSSGASNGAHYTLAIDGSALAFRDPSGLVYPTELKNGQLTIGNSVTIGDVSPGSALVPAGGIVRVTGTNFTPNTRLQFSEISIREQRFINNRRIDVVLAQSARMHGVRIRARNDERDDKSESEYFSYERTTAAGTTSDPAFSKAVPLFAPATYSTATVDMPKRPVNKGRRRAVGAFGSPQSGSSNLTIGFALQNLEGGTAAVSVELLDAAGNPYATNTVSVGSDQHLVRSIADVFGIVAPPSALRIRSNVPIQILGLTADSSGSVSALPPR